MKYLALIILAFCMITPASAQSFINNPAFQGQYLTPEQQQQLLYQQQQQQLLNATNQYSKEFKSKAAPVPMPGEQDLLPSGAYSISFVRLPGDADGITALRIESPIAVQGCAKAGFRAAQLERREKNIIISLDAPAIEMNDAIRYPHFECKSTGGVPSIDIELNRDLLLNNDIEYIILQSGNTKDRFKLYIDKQRMSLVGKNPGAFHFKNSVTHVFYYPDTLVLSAPGLNDTNMLHEQLSAIADKFGLTPAPYESPSKGLLFIDRHRKLAERMAGKDTITLDTIKIDDIFIGSKGNYSVPKTIDVFASRPGEYD